ncbi:MAG: hypothetical protein Q9195_008830 [Heterodermia aff. obscurata]
MAFLTGLHLSLFFYTILHLSPTCKSANKYGPVRFGRYNILNCSPTNATHLSHLLKSVNSAVYSAINDTERNTPSGAYNTFFNDITYSTFVHDILTMTITGRALGEQGSPIFWCVQGLNEIRYVDRNSGSLNDMWTRCEQHPRNVLQGMHGSSFIVVCPQFFTLQISDRPPEEHCLRVRHNRFKGNGYEMGFFRMWLVLSELVQYYVYAYTGSETDVFDVNKATWLGGKASTRNTANYVYYVASIYGNCTDFPILPVARPPEREFLAVPDNSTSEIGAGIVPDVQNVTVST